MTHRLQLRVYYEDTDLAGIVYYANYLKFIERGRSEWIRSIGIDQRALRETAGIVFAVRRVEADYLRPAVFDDELTATTELEGLSGARITLLQKILRDEVVLFSARVTLACLGTGNRPAALPEDIRRLLATSAENSAQ